MQAFLALAVRYEDHLIALVVGIPRIYAFLATSQLLSSTSTPTMSRNGVTLALAIFLEPTNFSYASQLDVHAVGALALLFAKEYAIGVVLGYLVAWIFWVVQTAGAFVDNQRGAAIASSIDPLTGSESSPIGDMFALVFVTYLFATAKILQALGLLFYSFMWWPTAAGWPSLTPDFPRLILGVFDHAMHLGVTIAAPIIAVMFLAEFSLAMVSRFAPQIQVFVLSMPIKSLIAIFMLVFYSVTLFSYMNRQVDAALAYSDRFFHSIAAGQLAADDFGRKSAGAPP